jgi:hypothetical protein
MEDKMQSQSAKVNAILSKLEQLDKHNQVKFVKSNTVEDDKIKLDEQQTVSDDFDVNSAKKQDILHYEQIIRKTLELFDINYDDLIRMDGKSAYNQAVQFYPNLLEEVKESKCPPLTALNIAKKMQPYMEFTAKYGSSIDDIKQNLKNEMSMQAKNEQSKKAKYTQTPAKPVQQTSMFSDISNAITQNTKDKKQSDDTLASFFYR